VVFSEQLGMAVFVAAGLSAPPAGKTYQLWFVRADGARPAGLFQPDANGQATQVLEGDLAGAEAMAFTVEPAGGSAQPTSKPLLTLPLTA
jgi:anti-sigma-K factor RskA